jgi:hypothetical protein
MTLLETAEMVRVLNLLPPCLPMSHLLRKSMPLAGTPPMQVIFRMCSGFIPRLRDPSKWSKPFVSFVHACLEPDVSKRPSAAELLKVQSS